MVDPDATISIPDWSEEVSVRFVRPYLDRLRQVIGEAAVDAFLLEQEIPPQVVEADEAWIPLSLVEAAMERLARELGEAEVERLAASVVGDAYGGPLARLARSVGSPAAFYRALPHLLPRFNRRTRVEFLAGPGARTARLVYHGEESQPLLCSGRAAQIAAVPTLWGLPPAKVVHLGCIHEGDAACTYQVTWPSSGWPWGLLVGLCSGTVLGILASILVQPAWPGFVLLLVVGGLAGLLADRERRHAATVRLAADQRESLESLLRTTEQRYSEAMEQVRRRRQAERAQQRLMERMADTDRLVNLALLSERVALHLNNALTIVTGNLEYIQSRLAFIRLPESEDPHDLRDSLAEAVHGSHRIQRIVGQLVRVTARGEPETLDLASAVEEALAVVPGDVEARLVRDYRPAGPVRVDGKELSQVLLNLVVQTAQAAPEGETVTVRVHGEDEGLTAVELSTEGWEMSLDAEVAHALDVCASLVDKLGGRMVLQGETLQVSLPRVDEPAPSLPPSREGHRLLMVDDEEMILRVLGRFLSRHDFMGCSSAREALRVLEADPGWDVILVDITMPEMDGLELHRILAQEHPELAARVVFMSGGIFSEAERDYLDSVPNPVLAKPLGGQDIEALLLAS